ncbi:hypothetical protein VHA_001794 [Grimontia hollisae CIP 101886]|uniref:Uncharacterized protein n=1 Tax=Grimontia hollisae CIP 101886 TaxID=675812 RepID=D0I7S0_GRIHO|nr:hypothetical protein VHA_001794 [Grimontia hollisae CIP 101886]
MAGEECSVGFYGVKVINIAVNKAVKIDCPGCFWQEFAIRFSPYKISH